MHNWFLVKVSYEKTLENGMQKKVTEPYLVDALSFTEAEARIIEELRPFISGEFQVTGINRAHYAEVFTDADGNRWYKVRLRYFTLDEKTGVEKQTPARMLVSASSLEEALANFTRGMKGTLSDYALVGIEETPIEDVYPYEAGEGGRP